MATLQLAAACFSAPPLPRRRCPTSATADRKASATARASVSRVSCARRVTPPKLLQPLGLHRAALGAVRGRFRHPGPGSSSSRFCRGGLRAEGVARRAVRRPRPASSWAARVGVGLRVVELRHADRRASPGYCERLLSPLGFLLGLLSSCCTSASSSFEALAFNSSSSSPGPRSNSVSLSLSLVRRMPPDDGRRALVTTTGTRAGRARRRSQCPGRRYDLGGSGKGRAANRVHGGPRSRRVHCVSLQLADWFRARARGRRAAHGDFIAGVGALAMGATTS